jgi:hypothetical protein
MRRRQKQLAYNEEHGIDPQTVRKTVTEILEMIRMRDSDDSKPSRGRGRGRARVVSSGLDMPRDELARLIQSLTDEMRARQDLRFEEAATARRDPRPKRAAEVSWCLVRYRTVFDARAAPLAGPMQHDSSPCRGSEHNLKNVDLELPRDRLVVFTGISGSGKSSLAFDTIYAEGQRRYVESLSAYARQFLGQMDKPDVDFIEGLSPAISIDQKSASRNPRRRSGPSNLRLPPAPVRIGVPHCPNCGRRITRQTPQQIVDRVLQLPEGTRFQVLAPVVRGRKGEYQRLVDELAGQGYTRARVDGELLDLPAKLQLERYEQHTIEVVVDRLVRRSGIERRLTDSLKRAEAR